MAGLYVAGAGWKSRGCGLKAAGTGFDVADGKITLRNIQVRVRGD